MKVSFHGAAREVTGSCHLVEVGKRKILIDCGLFQGKNGQDVKNRAKFRFNPKEIDAVLLTHAHLDHDGRLPKLKKQGFEGEIISTPATKDLAELVMLDSAFINTRNAKWETERLRRENKEARKNGGENVEPLFTSEDVWETMDHFVRTANYDEPIPLLENVQATFFDAGHIMGAASIQLDIREGFKDTRIVFSGDIGNNNKPIVRNPTLPPKTDYVVMESTYGDRSHKPTEESLKELYTAINQTFNNGGNVYIPTFAIERAQEILFFLQQGIEKGDIPKDAKIILDSPMAISATEIYKEHAKNSNSPTAKLFAEKIDLKNFPNLHLSITKEHSVGFNGIKQGAIVLAGGGMGNGGRIQHHMRHHLPRKECGFVFISYAASGTLARKIIDGAKSVRLFGHEIPVEAKVYTIGGFSAHAGKDELLKWQEHTENPKTTFLVHGDVPAMTSFAHELRTRGFKNEMPKPYDAYEL